MALHHIDQRPRKNIYLKKIYLCLITLPNSPDLNPIEKVWGRNEKAHARKEFDIQGISRSSRSDTNRMG